MYDNTQHELQYFIEYVSILGSKYYNIYYAYIKFPDNVPMTEGALYPVIVSDLNKNIPLELDLITELNNFTDENEYNTCSLGAINLITGEVSLADAQQYVQYKNKHVYYN